MTDTFQTRLTHLGTKHSKMVAEGVRYRIGRDGLITVAPQRVRVTLYPLRTLALLILSGFVFKALMFAILGADTYTARVAAFGAGGSPVERAGAWAMQADPVTVSLGTVLGALGG